MEYILKVRGEGKSPEQIVDRMGKEYMVYSYPADIVSFLDDSIRTLEVLEAIAETKENRKMREKVRTAKNLLV
jgi:superfamily II helicase